MERVVGPPGDPKLVDGRMDEREYQIVVDRDTIGTPDPTKTLSGFFLSSKIIRVLPACGLVVEQMFKRLPLLRIEMDTPHFIPLEMCTELPARMSGQQVITFCLAIMVAACEARKTSDHLERLNWLAEEQTEDRVAYTLTIVGSFAGLAMSSVGLPVCGQKMDLELLDDDGEDARPAWDPTLLSFIGMLQ